MPNSDLRWGAWANRPDPIPPELITRELSADVVIIGAGIAGMSCALRAAQAGAEVLVLEKSRTWTARGANIGIIDSSYMKARGWEYKAEDVAREWIKRCGNRCDEGILWRYLKNGGRAMDWLVDIVTRPEYAVKVAIWGCVYQGETYKELMTSHWLLDGPMTKKGDPQSVAEAINALHAEGLKLNARYIFNTAGIQLAKENGRVTGVIARDKDGYLWVCARRGVVLATGDISGNDEMCADLAPIANQCAKKITWPKNGNLGDGHRMGLWAGGSFEETPFPCMIHPQAYGYLQYCFLHVKRDGTRFMNEDNYVQGKCLALLRENEKFAWAIADSDWPAKVPPTLEYGGGMFWGQDCFRGDPVFDPKVEEAEFELEMKAGNVVKAETPEGLAEKMGIPPETFVRTLRRYNALCQKGADEDFGKRRELMIPLDKPPYFGMKFGTALLTVVGGLRVDTGMRVLDENKNPVEGLYAIGNVMGGRYGVDYPMHVPGNSCGSALTFGYLLGESFGSL
jgi:succinate dehydrogenase/fumarate reductase flavoprotein subunit